MAGTERLVSLDEHRLPGCLALSAAAKWNQNEADWRLMLGFGQGWGLELPDGTLAATTLILPYGEFAWISMVLVLPEHRRKGYATWLLGEALAELGRRGLVAVLDATPTGRQVYRQHGFRDCWGFTRYRLERPASALPAPPGIAVRRANEADWPQLLGLDRPAFGASRETVLRALAARWPEVVLLSERGGRIEGFLLGREGRTARQLGPLVAESSEVARALLSAALAAAAPPLYVDLADRETALREALEAAGFAPERPFTRMVRGADAAPGDGARVFLVAGPELG